MRTTWVLDSDGHAAAPPAGNTPLEGFAELQDPKQLHRLGPQNLFFALSPSPSSQGVGRGCLPQWQRTANRAGSQPGQLGEELPR